jgi:hypothetical protein
MQFIQTDTYIESVMQFRMLVVKIMSFLIVIQFVIGIQRFVIGLEIEMKILPHSYISIA